MNIQKIDIKRAGAAKAFAQSLKETGFAVVTNHSLSPDILQVVYETWAEFFADESKHQYMYVGTSQAGYFPFRSENAKDSQIKDLKEFYHIFESSDVPAGVDKAATLTLRSELTSMAQDFLIMLQQALPPDVRDALSIPLDQMITDSKSTLLRILHYPPLDSEVEPGAVRAAAHEDINLITLLPAATEPGLEVKDLNGDWYRVPCEPGDIVVNAGDMLQLATGGYFKSTTHRVVNPVGEHASRSRYSIPLFFHPRSDVVLRQGIFNHYMSESGPQKECLISELTAGEYLNQRLREIGLL